MFDLGQGGINSFEISGTDISVVVGLDSALFEELGVEGGSVAFLVALRPGW